MPLSAGSWQRTPRPATFRLSAQGPCGVPTRYCGAASLIRSSARLARPAASDPVDGAGAVPAAVLVAEAGVTAAAGDGLNCRGHFGDRSARGLQHPFGLAPTHM